MTPARDRRQRMRRETLSEQDVSRQLYVEGDVRYYDEVLACLDALDRVEDLRDGLRQTNDAKFHTVRAAIDDVVNHLTHILERQ